MSGDNQYFFGQGIRPMSEAEADAACYRVMEENAAAVRAARTSDSFTTEKGPTPRLYAEAEATDVEIPPELEEMLSAFSRPDRPTVCSAIAIPVRGRDLPLVIADPVTAEVKTVTASAEKCSATDFTAFPVRSLTELKQFDDLLRAMTELCRQFSKHNDYQRVRDDYCHLSISLNLIGKLAPGWRPKLKGRAGWGNDIHNVIHRDQVVIDLHWCHATKVPLMPQDADHAALFSDNENFHFDLAWMLARKKWLDIYRATEALCLTTFQQCQMLTLRGSDVAARLKGVAAGWRESGGKLSSKIARVKCLILQWAERDKRIQSRRDDYEMLWLARELLGRGTKNQPIAELHALMVGGATQDRTTIRDMLRSLDKHVPVT